MLTIGGPTVVPCVGDVVRGLEWRSLWAAVRRGSKPAAGNEIDKVNRACPSGLPPVARWWAETRVLQWSLSGSEAGEACGGARRETGTSTGENGVRLEPCHSSPDL
jgi:hypothetical protein